MSIANFLLKCKQSVDGIYRMEICNRFAFSDNLIDPKQVSRVNAKAILVKELNNIRAQMNLEIDKQIEEVLSDS